MMDKSFILTVILQYNDILRQIVIKAFYCICCGSVEIPLPISVRIVSLTLGQSYNSFSASGNDSEGYRQLYNRTSLIKNLQPYLSKSKPRAYIVWDAPYAVPCITFDLTHLDRDQMAAISQTTFPIAFRWMKTSKLKKKSLKYIP